MGPRPPRSASALLLALAACAGPADPRLVDSGLATRLEASAPGTETSPSVPPPALAARETAAAPSPAPSEVTGRPGDELVVGTLADPLTLDPHRATDLVSAAVIANVCEPLVRYRAGRDRPEAALATTWASVDGRDWTFTLREGVSFHDGAPLDAAAVVANLENLRAQRKFEGRAERIGPHVVAVSLDRANSALLATLAQPFFAMQSPRALGRSATPAVGTGPFRLARFAAGEVRLEANHHYWAGPPRLRLVVFRRYESQATLARALLDGSVDVTSSLTQPDVLHQSPRVTLDSQTGLNVAFLSVNNERKPFEDVRVRQALARAIDRRALVAHLLGGHGEPARNPLPSSIWAYSPRTKELLQDAPGARRLLGQAGQGEGFETTLMVSEAPRPYLPEPLGLAEAIQHDLGLVGIRAKLVRVASWSDYLERVGRGEYDLALLGWSADTTDPNDFLAALLGSESVGHTNRSRYRSEAMDALLERGRRTADTRERLAIYREAQDLFQRDMPWVPLYHVSAFTAYRRSVQGLSVDATGVQRYDKAWKQP